ncbi:elongation factor Ts [bacterium]|jgi:elongation factor Ts|nr:elongation factor Ts [bacterium]MBT3580705.1 elongation factor Ts [bacterium]MBT4551793.1 elongation factor Ts [bacterium]MBT5988688.1 elongation factor Ts [bacterium]MBT7087952.1 elongation factor Ts [bacterium]
MPTITASAVQELRTKTGVGMMACKKALIEVNGDIKEAIKYLREKGLSNAAKKAERATKEGSVFIQISDDHKTGVILEINCETDFVAKNDDFLETGNYLAQTILAQNNVDHKDDLANLKLENFNNFQEYLSEKILKTGENLVVKNLQKIKTSGFLSQYIHLNGKIGVLVEFSADVDSTLGKDISMQIAASNPLYVAPSDMPAADVEKEKEIIKKQVLNEGKPANIVDKIVLGKLSKYYKEVCLLEQAFVKNPDKAVKQILPAGIKINTFVRLALV